MSQELDKVGRFWARVLGLCDTIDAFLYGKKAWIVLALSVFAAVVGLLEWYSDQPPVFTVVTTFLLLFVLEALAIVRIGSLRDDDREWSLGLVFTRVGGVLSDGWDNITEFFGMPASLKLFVTGLVLAGSGLATLVGRNVAVCLARAASLVGFDAAADLEHLSGRLLYFGLGGVLCGGLFCLWSIKQDSDKRRELGGTGDYAGRLDGSSVALPAVIDCADTQAVDALARAVDHRLLRETLQVLAKWRPNLHENEAEYQRLLWRHIRQHLPAANPQRELPLRDPHTGRRGRADLVVGDAVLIEMKLKLSAGAVQRAVTQIAQYSRSWSNGPVMLLVCATDVEKARRCFGFEIEELRQKSSVCLVVAGGTRRELA